MSLKINLHQLPPMGGKWEGTEEDVAAFGLPEVGAIPLGPLSYGLEGGVSQGGFFATGSLNLKVRLQCVGCLRFFEYSISIQDFVVQIELEGRESVDLTPVVREDILLALPPYPRCDFQSGQSCPATFSADTNSIGGKGDVVWEPLKKLKPKKKS